MVVERIPKEAVAARDRALMGHYAELSDEVDERMLYGILVSIALDSREKSRERIRAAQVWFREKRNEPAHVNRLVGAVPALSHNEALRVLSDVAVKTQDDDLAVRASTAVARELNGVTEDVDVEEKKQVVINVLTNKSSSED